MTDIQTNNGHFVNNLHYTNTKTLQDNYNTSTAILSKTFYKKKQPLNEMLTATNMTTFQNFTTKDNDNNIIDMYDHKNNIKRVDDDDDNSKESSTDDFDLNNIENNYKKFKFDNNNIEMTQHIQQQHQQQHTNGNLTAKPRKINENNNVIVDADKHDKHDTTSPPLTPTDDEHNNVTFPTKSPEPSHHARRPMNAFLIFCKRHRSVVREKYPTLENRAVTKILGEWWAALDEQDKACYTALAKEYKDAFFSANPDFKWYKLPAPPLRTLNTRPGNYNRNSTCMGFECNSDNIANQETQHKCLSISGITPGKLADVTQMGSLSSLMDPNYNSIIISPNKEQNITQSILDQNITEIDAAPNDDHISYTSPVNYINSEIDFPPKPPKKRFTNNLPKPDNLNSSVSRNIFDSYDKDDDTTTPSSPSSNSFIANNNTPFVNLRNHALTSTQTLQERKLKRLNKNKKSTLADKRNSADDLSSEFNDDYLERYQDLDSLSVAGTKPENMTQQELINRIVDHSMCNELSSDNSNAADATTKCTQTPRKSVRSCKGKRYAEFMTEGRLVVNKRSRKNNFIMSSTTKSSYLHVKKTKQKPSDSNHIVQLSDRQNNLYSVDLNQTIQKLSDRTKIQINTAEQNPSIIPTPSQSELAESPTPPTCEFRERTYSETSDDSITKKMFRAADFNLDEKIEALPSLSLEKFQQRKKESKKRKKICISKSNHHHQHQHTHVAVASTTSKNVEDVTNTSSSNQQVLETNNNHHNLIGSRKRKARKESITHIELTAGTPEAETGAAVPASSSSTAVSTTNPDLSNLATLAEVAIQLGGKP